MNEQEPHLASRQETTETLRPEVASPEQQSPPTRQEQLKAFSQEWYGRATKALSAVTERLFPKLYEKKQQEELKNHIDQLMRERSVRNLRYSPGDGALAAVAKPQPSGEYPDSNHPELTWKIEQDKPAPVIDAPGFFDCTGIIFQTKDSVSVVHISPTTIYEEGETVDGTFDSARVPARNKDYIGTINTALHEIATPLVPGTPTNGNGYTVKKEKSGAPLTEDEWQQLQDLKVTLVGGRSMALMQALMGELDLSRKNAIDGLNLPDVPIDVYRNGDGGNRIIATPQEAFLVDSRNNIVPITPESPDYMQTIPVVPEPQENGSNS